MWIFYPIAGPIALALDKLLGKDLPELLSRSELCHMIETHQRAEESDIDALDRDILIGALSLNETPIETIMTPKKDVFTIDYKGLLTLELIHTLKKSGYTRFPVTWDDRVVGLLNIKRLVGKCSGNESIEKLSKESKLIHVRIDSMADDVLYRMIRGKVHIAVISDQTEWVGIVTMEDLLETLVGQEITDEFGH
jgi:CBS domain containing-hemolysin-like protein